MKPKNSEVCLCFHVELKKLTKYCRLEHPQFPSQLTECYGAGTGCGWCIPFLEKIFEAVNQGEEPDLGMSPEEYRQRRMEYRKSKQLPSDEIQDVEIEEGS